MLFVTTVPCGVYAHFIDGNAEAQGGKLAKITWPGSG